MKIDEQLWKAYLNPYFKFGEVLNAREFAVITAWNPASEWLSNEENCINNQRLAKDINHNEYMDVLVGDKDFCWAEESFAVVLTRQQALTLARKYGQNAIYYIQDNQVYLVSCHDEQEACIGFFRSRCYQ